MHLLPFLVVLDCIFEGGGSPGFEIHFRPVPSSPAPILALPLRSQIASVESKRKVERARALHAATKQLRAAVEKREAGALTSADGGAGLDEEEHMRILRQKVGWKLKEYARQLGRWDWGPGRQNETAAGGCCQAVRSGSFCLPLYRIWGC